MIISVEINEQHYEIYKKVKYINKPEKMEAIFKKNYLELKLYNKTTDLVWNM